jgi:hypothetical protein
VRKAVGERAQTTGSAVSRAASRAKVPLVAGGAALAGLAGGAALASRSSGARKVLGLPVPNGASLPRLGNGGSTAKALGSAAKEIGKAGFKLGELTTEVRKVREQINNE